MWRLTCLPHNLRNFTSCTRAVFLSVVTLPSAMARGSRSNSQRVTVEAACVTLSSVVPTVVHHGAHGVSRHGYVTADRHALVTSSLALACTPKSALTTSVLERRAGRT
jgi:hypothetical protein